MPNNNTNSLGSLSFRSGGDRGSMRGASGLFTETVSRSIANEALAKMMAIEKCDQTIINPVFGSDLTYKAKVSLTDYCNFESTVVSRYYDTAAIRKKYHNIQTIELSSINF